MSKRSLFLAAFLLLGAYALRLYRLEAQSIWWDEGISLHLATSSAAEIVRDRLNNIHPPLYFFLLKGWLALVGVSPFTGRYLSVLAGVGEVALVFAAARSWAGRAGWRARGRAGGLPWLAGGLMLISPLAVIYSQEIRVYALLPGVYFLLLLLAQHTLEMQAGDYARRVHAGSQPLFRSSARLLPLLVLVEWLAIHLHYIALFAVAYVGAWGAWVVGRRRDWRALRAWLLAHALVALASLPWFLAVVANWPAVQAEAEAGTFTTKPVPLPFLFAQVWAFHLTGLTGSLGSAFVRIAATLTGVIGAGLLLSTGWDRFQSRVEARKVAVITGQVSAHWALPLVAGLMVWSVRSFSHPRYIIMFAALLIPLAAILIAGARGAARRVVGVALGACFVALSVWGLRQYFFDPAGAKPDMRGVARYLATTAAPDDLILIPDTDWSLPFEYDGPAPVRMPGFDRAAGGAPLLAALDCSGDGPCARSGRVFVVDYPRGSRDWQNRLPYELERRGYWQTTQPFHDVFVREYRLNNPATPPDCARAGASPAAARFGPLDLEGAVIEQGAASDTAVTVALCWRPASLLAEDYTVTLLLRDAATGERIAQADALLLDGRGAPARFWSLGELVVTYHVLPLAPGTPPLALLLSLGVYTPREAGPVAVEATNEGGAPLGQLLPLGNVALSSPVGLVDSPYGAPAPPLWPAPAVVTGGLELLSARLDPGPYRPGQAIRARLTWRATAPLPNLRPILALEQGGATLIEVEDAPAQGRYPTDRWGTGEVVSEVRDLRVPPGAAGEATVALWLGTTRIVLGRVTIGGAAVQFTPPGSGVATDVRFGDAIRLAGYESPPATVDPSQTLPVTLYWQALSSDIPTGYIVFVQLLDASGRLIAQSDAVPAAGARPANEWLEGEYVTDAHELVWRTTGYSGQGRLIVGLYDPLTGERLRAADGADHYALPVGVNVLPGQ